MTEPTRGALVDALAITHPWLPHDERAKIIDDMLAALPPEPPRIDVEHYEDGRHGSYTYGIRYRDKPTDWFALTPGEAADLADGLTKLGVGKAADALRVIFERTGKPTGCENFTPGSCRSPGYSRQRETQYGADQWCAGCVAADALGIAP
jgi:hypothetical protein